MLIEDLQKRMFCFAYAYFIMYYYNVRKTVIYEKP